MADEKATHEQLAEITNLCAEQARQAVWKVVYNKPLTRTAAEAFLDINKRGELDEALEQAIAQHVQRCAGGLRQEDAVTAGEYADEEVVSGFGYFSGYSKPKGITEQANILRQLMPGIGFANEKLAEAPILSGSEGWFAIPRWKSVAKTYEEAVQTVLDLIKEQRKGRFCNCREGYLGEQYLRRHERTEKALSALGEEQKGYDILVVAAQFGLKHRGRSVLRARVAFAKDEFGLGVFEIACMLLTHPERLKDWKDLRIDCAGDEYAPVAAGVWSCAPYCYFDGIAVRFGADGIGYAYEDYGAVSGFAAQ